MKTSMNWNDLLCTTRKRELLDGEPSELVEGDPRDAFEHDYGRVVFSTPLRRLQDKAQVFPLEKHDAVRTRLTHSFEVSSVAKSLGKAVGRFLSSKNELPERDISALEAITATCGLLHDLGNPPFGHSGEDAIRAWFREKSKDDLTFFDSFKTEDCAGEKTQAAQDFLNFEGNAQTLRLISRLQVLSDKHGLNLTAATISAACKYIAKSDDPKSDFAERKKPGFFLSEKEVFNKVREVTGTTGVRHPLTFLVEASDDIVYSTVDLEDAIKKGVMRWSSLEERLRAEFQGEPKILNQVLDRAKKKVKLTTPTNSREDEALAQAFRTHAIIAMVASTIKVFQHRYHEIMSGSYHDELVQDGIGDASALTQACKKVGQKYVYGAGDNLQLELMGRSIILDLMELFWEGASKGGPNVSTKKFEGKLYRIMSQNYCQVMEEEISAGKLPERYHRLQLVTDYISGMTDTFASALHKSLKNA